MENPLFVIVPEQRRVLAARGDLTGIEAFLVEVTGKTDAQQACEQLTAKVVIDFDIATELEKAAYVRGYQQSIIDGLKKKSSVKIHRFAPVEVDHA